MSLLPSIKTKTMKLDDIQWLELRIEFLSSVTWRIQISKNFSLPFNSVPSASNISCPPTPSPCAASLDSTHSRDSDISTHTLQMSCISSTDLLPRQFQVPFWEHIIGYSYCRRRTVYHLRLRSCILWIFSSGYVNPLNAELNPICHLLALLGAHHILHVSRIRDNIRHWIFRVDLTAFCLMIILR